MSRSVDYPVLIMGGGMVGLYTAALLAEAGIRCCVVEKNPYPSVDLNTPVVHPRVCALNWASCDSLRRLGAWEYMEASAGYFRRLCAWQEHQRRPVVFDCAEIAYPALGANVPNAVTVEALRLVCEASPLVTVLTGYEPERLLVTDHSAVCVFTNGESISASLLMGADGVHSWVREAAGISTEIMPYNMHAMVTTIRTQKPHQQTGWQVFLEEGPFAVLPLAEAHTSAVVWSQSPESAKRRASLSPLERQGEMQEVFGDRLGPFVGQADACAIPLTYHHAHTYTSDRVVLVGDAAHRIHPLAGQGVNLGCRDAEVLVSSLAEVRARGGDLGSKTPLVRYTRARRLDNGLMLKAMDGLLTLYAWQGRFPAVGNAGQKVVNQLPLVNKACMRYAMGLANP